jgi:gephyrin
LPFHEILNFPLIYVASDEPGEYKVLTPKTHNLSTPIPKGHIFRINTGGPLPAGADTVIMVEDTQLVSTIKDSDGMDEEDVVRTLAKIPPQENVRAPGSDVRNGDLVLEKGEVISAVGGEIGTLAFVGRKEVCIML